MRFLVINQAGLIISHSREVIKMSKNKKSKENKGQPVKEKDLKITVVPMGMMVKAKTFIVSLFKKQL
jgi:hypothetical protein